MLYWIKRLKAHGLNELIFIFLFLFDCLFGGFF